jgi:tRNA-specific 2-thiouridylase
VRETTFPSGSIPTEPFEAEVKVRYKALPARGNVMPLSGGRARVKLFQPQRAVTPGQAAVFYGGSEADVVVGGGLIEG